MIGFFKGFAPLLEDHGPDHHHHHADPFGGPYLRLQAPVSRRTVLQVLCTESDKHAKYSSFSRASASLRG